MLVSRLPGGLRPCRVSMLPRLIYLPNRTQKDLLNSALPAVNVPSRRRPRARSGRAWSPPPIPGLLANLPEKINFSYRVIFLKRLPISFFSLSSV